MSTTYTASPATIDVSGTVQITNPADGDALTASSNNVGINGLADIVKAVVNKAYVTVVTRHLVLPVFSMKAAIGTDIVGNDVGDEYMTGSTAGYVKGVIRLPRNSTIGAIEILATNATASIINLTGDVVKYPGTVTPTKPEIGFAETVLANAVSVPVAAGGVGVDNWAWYAITLSSPGTITDDGYLFVAVTVPLLTSAVKACAVRATYSVKGIDMG